jgi:hypothetical protein
MMHVDDLEVAGEARPKDVRPAASVETPHFASSFIGGRFTRGLGYDGARNL